VIERSIAYRLLCLFTSPDRAESIEGDLIEERHTHGHVWFFVNVATTTFALWRQAIELKFLRTMALAVLAVVLSVLMCSAIGFVYVELEVSGVVTLLLIATFAFLLGAALARVAPVVGVAAATAASVVLVLLFLYAQIDSQAAQLREAPDGNTVVASAGALVSLIRKLAGAVLLYLLPLNLGSALMHGRGLRR
jgi:type IV secretory pathway VirB6-like protein